MLISVSIGFVFKLFLYDLAQKKKDKMLVRLCRQN